MTAVLLWEEAANLFCLLARMCVRSQAVVTAPLAMSKWEFGRRQWFALLRRTLETAGAFFIKWGQWAATRHDIFPPGPRGTREGEEEGRGRGREREMRGGRDWEVRGLGAAV
jgi:hypothetical protein